MEKFENVHDQHQITFKDGQPFIEVEGERFTAEEVIAKLAQVAADDAALYDTPEPEDLPETDLTDEETERLAQALAGITDTITNTLGYFKDPVTRQVFMDTFKSDQIAMNESGEVKQVNRYLVRNAWEALGVQVSRIFLVITGNKPQAIKAASAAFPERTVDEDYLEDALEKIGEALAVASKTAKEISAARGEDAL